MCDQFCVSQVTNKIGTPCLGQWLTAKIISALPLICMSFSEQINTFNCICHDRISTAWISKPICCTFVVHFVRASKTDVFCERCLIASRSNESIKRGKSSRNGRRRTTMTRRIPIDGGDTRARGREREGKENEPRRPSVIFVLTLLSFPFVLIRVDSERQCCTFSKMYSSDTECTRRTETSIRSLHSTISSNRYVRGLGSHQDLSKRSASVPSPNISELIYNHETFPLLAEFLQIHGRESLIGFCAIVIGIGNLSSDRRQALYAVRAAYRQYIHDPSVSNHWLQTSTREWTREQISQRTFDPYQIFQPAMKDMLSYLKQNFYANFLSSKLWKNYLMKKQQQEKRLKTLNASTPKKINLSISTSTIKSSKASTSKREILTSFNANKTTGKLAFAKNSRWDV